MGAPRRCLTAAGRLLAVGGCVSCCCSSSFLAPQTKRFKQPATSAGHMTGPMSAAARTPDGQVDPGWRGTPPPTTHVAAAERMSLAAVRGGCGGYVARRVGRRPRRRHATKQRPFSSSFSSSTNGPLANPKKALGRHNRHARRPWHQFNAAAGPCRRSDRRHGHWRASGGSPQASTLTGRLALTEPDIATDSVARGPARAPGAPAGPGRRGRALPGPGWTGPRLGPPPSYFAQC